MKRTKVSAPSDPPPILQAADTLRAGSVYSFRTSPLSEFAPPETGRFAAFKVLDVGEELIGFGVLSGIWSDRPTLKDVEGASLLHEHRFAHTGRIAAFGVNADWWAWSDLEDVAYLGTVRLTAEELALGARISRWEVGCSYGPLSAANYSAEGEWRWVHDRDAFTAETDKVKAKADAERAAKEMRHRTRLKGLTWAQLLSERPFERWAPSPPFPPIEFTEAARTVVHDACRELDALGPKPPKAKVRSVLRRCVEWFNRADEAAGNVIETEEREDICAVLEEMAFVARHKSLVDEIDAWREW